MIRCPPLRTAIRTCRDERLPRSRTEPAGSACGWLVEDSLDIETCEGAATIGLELAGTVPSFDAVLIQPTAQATYIPVSGQAPVQALDHRE